MGSKDYFQMFMCGNVEDNHIHLIPRTDVSGTIQIRMISYVY